MATRSPLSPAFDDTMSQPARARARNFDDKPYAPPIPDRTGRVLFEHPLDLALVAAVRRTATSWAVNESSLVAAAVATVVARYSGDGALDLIVAREARAQPTLSERNILSGIADAVAVTSSASFRETARRISAVEPHHGPEAGTASPATTGEPNRLPGFADVTVVVGAVGPSLAKPAAAAANVDATHDVIVAWRRDGDCGTLVFAFVPSAYGHEVIERMAGHVATVLAAALLGADAAAAADAALATFGLMTARERAEHDGWNATDATWSGPEDLVTLVGDALATHAAAPALTFGGATITYGALEQRVAKLASVLRDRGVAPESIVAVFVERSSEMIACALAAQRAGGSYLPINPSDPADRVRYLLEDAAAHTVITERALRDRIPEEFRSIVLLDDSDEIAAAPPLAATPADPSQRAYVIYTSGSTGKPKGVEIEQRSVVNLLRGMREALGIGPGDTLVALAPLAFDMSVPDVFLPLVSGARTVIAPRAVASDPIALASLLDVEGATHVQATPSTWRMLVESGWRGRPGLVAVVGGEALSAPLAAALIERGIDVRNFYGPTEATVWATTCRITDASRPITIGAPMPNVRTWILDSSGDVAPRGVVGELCIGGAGVARGYLSRAELTAQKFVDSPEDASGKRTRMYRTGDLARYGDTGAIEFIGRADAQVKLRGYRIELGEVEAALAACRSVTGAAALVREDDPGDPHLVAYVTVARESPASPAELRQALTRVLPAHMVPDRIGVLQRIPLNANGKVDRRALADLPRETAASGGEHVPPRTELEARIVRIWEEVLKISPIGVTDDFFALGATSLGARRVFERIQREFGDVLPITPLFQAPTVERLAALIERPQARRWRSLVPVQTTGTRTPIFFVHGGGGTIVHFFLLSRRLHDRPFYGLQLRGLYGDVAPVISISKLARFYNEEVRAVQPAGPYVIGGYCFGVNVAYEMARQLEAEGERVALVIGINGTTPSYLRRHGGPQVDEPEGERGPAPRGLPALLRNWQAQMTIAMVRLEVRLRALLGRPLRARRRRRAHFDVCHIAERSYRPAPWNGRMLLFTAPELYRGDRDLGWSSLVGDGLTIEVLPGPSRTQRDAMYEPLVAGVAARIEEALAELMAER